MIMIDSRVPVVFGPADAALPEDAVLWEGETRAWSGASASFTPDAGHAPGCACCAGRTEAGRALAALLHARARNQIPFFRRVLVVIESEAGRSAVEAALANDPVAAACFRKEEVLF
jgi:hypothetical protein